MDFIPMSTVDDRYYIVLNGELFGVIEYIEYDDMIDVSYIKIHKEYRRMGIATYAISILKNKRKMIVGDALPEAIEFWKSVNAEFYDPIDNNGIMLTPFIIIN